jgi:hypothetical protein
MHFHNAFSLILEGVLSNGAALAQQSRDDLCNNLTITKASTTLYSSLPLLRFGPVADVVSAVENVSEAVRNAID